MLTKWQGITAQITQTNSISKSPAIKEWVGHITDPQSMLFSEGALWKKSRSLFNPGFSLSHLMTLAPTIVDDVSIYCRIIGEHADSGEVRPIKEALAFLTIDVMGHVVLDLDFYSQTSKNEMIEALPS